MPVYSSPNASEAVYFYAFTKNRRRFSQEVDMA